MAGHLVCLPYDTPGKVGHKPSTLYVSSRAITDFDVSRFDDLLAVGGEDGKVSTRSTHYQHLKIPMLIVTLRSDISTLPPSFI